MEMNYQPNLDDPRVRGRIQQSYGFARGCLRTDKPRQWSTRYIDKYFGSQSNTLSKWIRNTLLTVTNDKFHFGDKSQCKEYILNAPGADYIREVLKGSTQTYSEYLAQHLKGSLARSNTSSAVAESCLFQEREQEKSKDILYYTIPYCSRSPDSTVYNRQFDSQVIKNLFNREYSQELAHGDFVYKDKSARLWHPLQNLSSDHRSEFFADHGYAHQYDLDCAAPTLIYQKSQQLGSDVVCVAIEQLLNNKHEIRQRIADQAELSVREVKVLLNALFAGARLGRNQEFATSSLLHQDPARIEWFCNDLYIKQLRADIRDCWDPIIEHCMPRARKPDKNGRMRLIPINSKRKWAMYFDLERQVLNAVQDYMKSTDNPVFLEHDGWTCRSEIDQAALKQHVYTQTGFRITLSHKENF